MTCFVFDIETIPDVVGGRTLYSLDGLSDAETAEAMFALRREKTGHAFLPHYLQKIVAISIVMARGDQVKVWSLGDEQSDEKELISRFFKGIDQHTPTLISWNGSGFDLPVLHYRALFHNITAPTYWEVGEHQSTFKWNNYLNRFHYRHLDLMDVLAGYQNKAVAPLDDIATLLGFPGKMGMSGDKVWDAYQAGELSAIRNYCETDVLNTYGIYLRFERMRGNMTEKGHQEALHRLQEVLSSSDKPHLQAFLNSMTVKSVLSNDLV